MDLLKSEFDASCWGYVSCGHCHFGFCLAYKGCVASSLHAATGQGPWFSCVQLSYSRLGIQASSGEADTGGTSRNLFTYFCREADILRDVDRVGHSGRFWEISKHQSCVQGSPSDCEILSASSSQRRAHAPFFDQSELARKSTATLKAPALDERIMPARRLIYGVFRFLTPTSRNARDVGHPIRSCVEPGECRDPSLAGLRGAKACAASG